LLQGAFELVLAQEALLDEEAAEGSPGDAGRFHDRDIGTNLAEIKDSWAN
jgi:hypothetical protein